MRTFQDLLVWQKAHQLVITTYQLTRDFPVEERYGLISQMRRAAVSVAANITEGHQRSSRPDFLKFLDISHSSLDELKYYFILAQDLRYLNGSAHHEALGLAEEVGRMLNGLETRIKQEVNHGPLR